MALHDNPLWLLSHIRHSFLACDDTGNCELVLGSSTNTEAKDAQIVKQVLGFDPLPLSGRLEKSERSEENNSNEDDEEEDDVRSRPRSLEIRPYGRGNNPLFGVGSGAGGGGVYMRPRCNTELKLEKMKRDKQNAPPRVKTVQWKNPPAKNKDKETPDILEKLFPEKSIETSYESTAESKFLSASDNHNGVVKPISQLSQLLDQFPSCPENPFADFSRHGAEPGSTSTDHQKRDLTIILTGLMSEKKEVSDPKIHINDRIRNSNITVPSIDLCIRQIPGLTVRQVVGYVCWVYTNEGRRPVLQADVDAYTLKLADQDGEVEWDMPALDHHEQFARYGFQVLSLVTVKEDISRRRLRTRDIQLSGASSSTIDPSRGEHANERIKVVLPDGTKVEVPPPSKDTTVRQFVDIVLEDHLKSPTSIKNESAPTSVSKFNRRIPLNFNLEAKGKPGIALDPAAPFFSFRGGSEIFYIVRENSRRYSSKSDLVNLDRGDDTVGSEDVFTTATSTLNDSIHACAHKEFHGLQRLTAKLKIKSEVTMTISNEKVEIYPSKIQNNSVECGITNVSEQSFLSHRPKTESYNLEDIVNCEVIVKKSNIPGSKTPNSKFRLRLILKPNKGANFMDTGTPSGAEEKLKKVDFECNMDIAKEIESKLNHLLSYPYSSKSRIDYLASLTKKTKRI